MNPIDIIIGQFKTGWRTSEFWLVLAAGVWNAVYPAYNPHLPLAAQLTNLGVLAAAAIYAVAVSYKKGKRNTALATVAVASINAAVNAAAGAVGGTDPGTPDVSTTPAATVPAGATGTTATVGASRRKTN